MKALSAVVGALLLLVLLTWLLLRGLDTNKPAYADTLQAIDDFALAEATLHRNVLQARAGVLRNYDTLGRAVEAMEEVVARLRTHVQREGLETDAIDRLAAAVARQEDLAEHFKTSNALRQNSLSYVGLLTTSPEFGAGDAQLVPATGALAAAILHLTRDTSPESVVAFREQISRFAAQAPAVGPDAEVVQALLAHARLLLEVLPAVDETLRVLAVVPSRQPLEDIRAMFSAHQAAVEATAQRYRLILYLISLLLLVALLRLGQRLRARALALRQRAAFERIIAENSTRLINSPPGETAARLQQVLGDLGKAIAVDRAYVALAEDPVRVHAWSADGARYPPGWPDEALAISEQLSAVGHDIVAVRDIAALPPGEAKSKLAAAGVRSWACVSLVRAGGVRGIMGFDKFQPAWGLVFPLSVVRLAGDAVANAIEREFLEHERTTLTTRLERARRLQMVGSLASGIAHNFNNIIGAILGYSEMVEPQLAPGTKPAQQVDEIRRAAERGRDLIDNILTFGRRRDGDGRIVEVRALFAEAAALLHASLPGDVDLVVADVPGDLAVSGEPTQLQQVILNLCTNAAQAIDGRGSILVTAEAKDVRAVLRLSHGDVRPGRYVCLAVDDSGRGFGEAVARRLFEPFFSTRAAGTGLGLATVREIVRDHDGAMNVHSKPRQGSRFEAWLPAAAADAAAAIGPSPPLVGRGETVLVVESERERLLRNEETLAALGYEPVGFDRPADAIAAYRAAPERFDAVVISHAVPAPDGLRLARALHEIASRQPILLAAAAAIDVRVDELAEAGISEVLRRPLVSTELAAALARSLRTSGRLQA
jgi:signal transduction histidine kinase